MNSAPELLSPSRSVDTPSIAPPVLAESAASIAAPDADWVSGGISCVVDSYLTGSRNASRAPAMRPTVLLEKVHSETGTGNRCETCCRDRMIAIHQRAQPEPRCTMPSSHKSDRRSLFGWDPVDLFLQMLLGESDPLQHALAILNHVRMAAQVSHRIGAIESPLVGVLS